MSEQAMAGRVVKMLKPLDAVRVENPCHPGTPDVNYVGGWIELKKVDKWPARETTPLRLPHFTAQQKVWLTRRINKGGNAYVLLQVSREYILLRGDVAAKILGEATREELVDAAIFCVGSRDLPSSLMDALQCTPQ